MHVYQSSKSFSGQRSWHDHCVQKVVRLRRQRKIAIPKLTKSTPSRRMTPDIILDASNISLYTLGKAVNSKQL